MEVKSNNPKMTQKEISTEIGLSDRTVSRFRKDINMTSPYKSTNPRHKNDKIRHVDAENNDENHQITTTPKNV